MRNRATAADVARIAGASRSAVSMVLNGRADGNVSPDLQERIRSAVDQLGYVPQNIGRSLRAGSTKTVGVITDEIVTSPFAGDIISGTGAVGRQADFMIMVADTEGETGRIAEVAEVFFSRGVDALMLATGGLVDTEPPDSFFALPSVLANCTDTKGRASAVIADEAGGSVQAVQHLLDLGHRNITLLAGTEDSPATAPRRDGFHTALSGNGVRARVAPCGWDIDEGHHTVSQLLDQAEPPTAVLASNDRTAVGALLAAAHHGLRVPEDLSVVGVDDQPHVAANVVPALTTVALPHRQIGMRAMEVLLQRFSAPHHLTEEPTVNQLPTELIVRDSTSTAPGT